MGKDPVILNATAKHRPGVAPQEVEAPWASSRLLVAAAQRFMPLAGPIFGLENFKVSSISLFVSSFLYAYSDYLRLFQTVAIPKDYDFESLYNQKLAPLQTEDAVTCPMSRFYSRHMDDAPQHMGIAITFELGRGMVVCESDKFSGFCDELHRALVAIEKGVSDYDVSFFSCTHTTVTCVIRTLRKSLFMVELIQRLSESMKVSVTAPPSFSVVSRFLTDTFLVV